MSEAADLRSRRPGSASPLAAAHDELLRRCHAAERADDWQEGLILSVLVNVTDYVKRIGDNPDSSHYRAEKAGALLTAAIRLHRDALLAYGGWPEDDRNEQTVHTASRMLEDVAEHARETMWQAMRSAREESPAAGPTPGSGLVQPGEQLARWSAQHRAERSAGGIGI